MSLPAHWFRIRLHRLGDPLPSGKRATGKEPAERGWQKSRSTEAPPDAYGILPGPSGLAVLDIERAGLELFPDPGRGLLVRTPSMALHVYIALAAAEKALGRTLTGKLKCMVPGKKLLAAELISFGGQVVGPGTRALSEKSGMEGVYTIERDEPPLDDPELVAKLLAPFVVRSVAVQAAPVRSGGRSARARAAPERETSAVLSAPPGQRHDTLLRAASALASLVPTGELEEAEVRGALLTCARASQPDQIHEAERAIEDGIRFGLAHPRATPLHLQPRDVEFEIRTGPVSVPDAIDTPPPSDALPDSIPAHITRTVLVPGTHKDSMGEFHEQSNQGFAAAVLDVLPPGLFYRRDQIPGQVHGARFIPASETTFRRLLSEPHVRLARWVRVKDEEGTRQVEQTVPCGPGEAALVLDAAAQAVSEIKLLTNYPVLMPDMTVSPPGFHDGVYYAGEPIEPELDPAAIRAHLEDLVVDFPFEDPSSRTNFFGFLLTPVLRAAIGGSVPLTVFSSPKAGSGKGYLIGKVAGISITGRTLGSATLPQRKEELSQWTFSLALSGKTLAHIDNLPPEVDSGELAALVTGEIIDNRVLGRSGFGEAINTLTVAMSGNNLKLSDELMRRTVVVRLKPPGARPEDRTEWAHEDIGAYCLAQRQRTLACLLGAVVGWAAAGSPRGLATMGSFERWGWTVGGVLAHLGYTDHLANRAAWRERGGLGRDEAVEALLRAWWHRYNEASFKPAELLLPFRSELEEIWEKPSSIGLGRLLSSLADRVFEVAPGVNVRVAQGWSEDKNRAYCLEIVVVRS